MAQTGWKMVGRRRSERDPKAAFEQYYREAYPLVYNYIFRRVSTTCTEF